jgi:hypothetical protein
MARRRYETSVTAAEAALRRQRQLTLVAAYAVWFLAGALGIAVLLAWHDAMDGLYSIYAIQSGSVQALWAYSLFSNTVVVVFALVWLVLVVVGEAWFRGSVEKQALRRRALRTVLVEAIALGVGLVVQWVT